MHVGKEGRAIKHKCFLTFVDRGFRLLASLSRFHSKSALKLIRITVINYYSQLTPERTRKRGVDDSYKARKERCVACCNHGDASADRELN